MTSLVRWDPFRELAQWQNEVERFFRGFAGTTTNGEQRWVPALDVWETDGEIVYAFDLPGVPEDRVSVEYEDGSLTVSAERERSEEVSKEKFYRVERRYGRFARTIGLPQGVTESDIHADYKDGVLEVHVTKPKAPEPRRIEIGLKGTIEGKAKQT